MFGLVKFLTRELLRLCRGRKIRERFYFRCLARAMRRERMEEQFWRFI